MVVVVVVGLKPVGLVGVGEGPELDIHLGRVRLWGWYDMVFVFRIVVQYSGEMREPRGGVGDTFSPELFGMTFEGSYTVYDSKGRKRKRNAAWCACVCVYSAKLELELEKKTLFGRCASTITVLISHSQSAELHTFLAPTLPAWP